MISLSIVGRSPGVNPDSILVKGTFSGNTGVQGTGDLLNLAPVSGANPNGMTDPLGIGLYPDRPLTMAPVLEAEDIGGYYVQPHLGTTLLNNALRMYSPGGGEVASTTAYSGLAATNPGGAQPSTGSVLLKIYLPQFQA
jgi:hypothetical protein